MLIPKGSVVHENLSTAFTHIDQFIEGLQGQQFSGCCHVSFWEYDGVLFFEAGNILNGREEIGMRSAQIHTGDTAVHSILAKAHEKDGEISVYQLPERMVATLVSALNAATKYEKLSTDLTSLDKLIALLQKEHLSGYIEVLLEDDAGIANLFFEAGELIETLLAPPDNQMLAESETIEKLDMLCQEHGAVFNIYQFGETISYTGAGSTGKKTASLHVIKLFEAILVQFESVTDMTGKPGMFHSVFKTILPRIADKYEFLDPFIGDFRYANASLSYHGDATYDEFVNGMIEVINATLQSILTRIPKNVFLPQISRAAELVYLGYSDLVEQLNLEVRMPEIFRDYSFLEKSERESEGKQKGTETRKVLNLQGVGISEIGSDSILNEFYRITSLIVQNYVEPEGNVVHYAELKKSREFQQYRTATAFLQQFEISFLKNRNERLAFWINLYNFLVIDAVLEYGVKIGVQDIKGFFTKTSYRLGEYLFSLDDIEHGILRNNRRKPYSLFQQFSNTDLRSELCLSPVDYRIHCCFSCAAKSSPSLAVYTPENLDEQLDSAVTRYLVTNGIHVDRGKYEIWLARTFYWYRKDFEQDGRTLLDVVLQYLKGEELGQFIQHNRAKLTLHYMDYDWSLNGK